MERLEVLCEPRCHRLFFHSCLPSGMWLQAMGLANPMGWGSYSLCAILAPRATINQVQQACLQVLVVA